MLDVYVTAGDAELSSKASATKGFQMSEHGNPKDLFHFATRRTLCS